MRAFKYLALLAILGAGIIFFIQHRHSPSAEQIPSKNPPEQVQSSPSEKPFLTAKNGYLPPRFTQADHQLQNDPGNPADLPEEAERLKNFKQSEQDAMNDIHTLIGSCGKFANQGDFPTGLNVEITNVLLGENYRKIAYIPDSHPRINQNGELTDKWGSPYQFHSISTKRIEITSAGPDKTLYTEDDITLDVR